MFPTTHALSMTSRVSSTLRSGCERSERLNASLLYSVMVRANNQHHYQGSRAMLPVSDQFPVIPIEHEPVDEVVAWIRDAIDCVEVRDRGKFCDRVRDCIEGICVACDRHIVELLMDD